MKLNLQFLKNTQYSYNLSYPNLLQKNYNERIDDFKCKISHLPTKIDIKLKDLVLISDLDDEIDDFYMIICSYSITQDSLDNTTYSYDLQLCSETKDLEGYICPQMSITPLKVNPRSVYWYLNKFNEEYGAKIRVKDSNDNIYWTTKWTYSQRVINKFSSIIAPELQWNTPTFKEVLTDLMMVKDCIPIVRNNVIDYIDLTETKNQINYYNYFTWSNELSNYASELQMDMQNVMQTKINNINDTTTTLEYIPFSSSEYTMTSNNYILKTKYPILKINKLEMIVFSDLVNIGSPTTSTIQPKCYRRDLTNIDGYSLVYESQEYQTKSILYTTGSFDPTNTGAYYSQYKNYCLYYTRGNNEIVGFNDTTKKYGVLPESNSTLEWLGMITSRNTYLSREENTTGSFGPYYYQYFFVIEYETTKNQVFRTSKDDIINHHTIIDNQTNAWVDAFTQGNLEKQKANRMSNETIMFNQRWETGNLWNPADIGDYWIDNEGNKNIVYQVQYQIFQDHIDINGYMCKNYILKDYFTSVNSKVRTWVNATDEAFEKQILDKYYIEFSKSRHREKGIPNIATYLASSINSSVAKPLKYIAIQTKDNNNNLYPPETQQNEYYFVSDLIARIMGNSLVFTGGFDNNTVVDKQMKLTEDDFQQSAGGRPASNWYRYWINIKNSSLARSTGVKMQTAKYVDSNFENEETYIRLGEDIKLTNANIVDGADTTLNDIKSFMVDVYQFPIVHNANVTSKFSKNFTNHKDNKEIPNYTIQFEYTTDTRDIYFTKEWIKNERAIRTITKPSLSVKLVNYEYGKETNDGTLTDWTILGVADSESPSTSLQVRLSGSSIDLTGKALAICDGNKNLLVINPKITGTRTQYTFYINALREKDKSIYDSSDHKVKVGEI